MPCPGAARIAFAFRMLRRGAALAVLASSTLVTALGCSPKASAGIDAHADARAADAGASDAAPTAALAPDAAPPTDTNLPPASSDELTTRAKHLLEAIAHDNADLGTDLLFPRDAYVAARDAADPGKAWDAKVVTPFRRHVHLLNKRGRRNQSLDTAQFVAFELGHTVSQITPKKHEWKRPLWRVTHSKLTYAIDGHTQRIEIAEMLSWRGAWYVTKLK